MVKDGLRIDVTSTSAPTNFYSAYQGFNDRDLQINLASLISAPQPRANRVAKKKSGKTRVGFVSRHFRNHTIGRLNLGIVQKLPREDFDVTVISVGSHDDMMAKAFAAGADHYVSTTTNLQEVRQRISEQELDILYFSDVGMDTLTYSLCMSRMAPIQCVTWGHPETTGSPVMDYFVSSKTLEIPEADEHYSEKLARFEVLNVYYYRPNPPEMKDHAYFGLDPKRNVYLCFQNLFKIHPDFDEVLNGILSRDPLGDIVMMEGRHPEWTELLRNRWRRTLGANMERIKFLPGQSHPDFMSLNALADVSLDPMHFGGGNTTYEALSVGLPVVTLPSKFLRARITNAMYQQMNMRDLIVETPAQYIDLAVRLGTDKSYRQQVSTKVLDQCGVLFEDEQAIAEFAKFFRSLPQG